MSSVTEVTCEVVVPVIIKHVNWKLRIKCITTTETTWRYGDSLGSDMSQKPFQDKIVQFRLTEPVTIYMSYW